MRIEYNWQYSEVFEPIFDFKGRYIALTGGRSSGKSWFVAHFLLEKLMYKKIDLLCCREHQNSISESNYKLFVNIIKKYSLPYEVQATRIISKSTGSVIVFIGLSDITADNVKSYEDFGLVWVEEAQKISKKSWDNLNPTIRSQGAQIFITMNPEVTHGKHPIMSELTTIYRNKTLHIHVNYDKNPFVSKDIIEMAELTRINKPDDYKVIWLGQPDDNMGNLIIKGFTEQNKRKLYYQKDLDLHISCDFNYDPMAWVFFHKDQNKIYVFDELIKEHTTTKDCAHEVIDRYGGHKGAIILNGDAAGNQHNCMATNPDLTNFKIIQRKLENHFGRHVDIKIHRGNPHKIKRFEAFNNLVKRYDGEICFYIDPDKCKWTVYNIENAKYKEGTREVDEPTINDIKKDRNKKFLIHPLDAVTYPAEYYFPIK
ncbi:MAG: PBSX family phage terminase large subunit [Candidatus Gastranaerophilales bacterium]|nr:PBSX family phage terminase large subunit [Candidatus Gastranaerophilales bacterium]